MFNEKYSLKKYFNFQNLKASQHILFLFSVFLLILLSDFNHMFLFLICCISLIYVIFNEYKYSLYLIITLYPFDSAFIISSMNDFDVFNILMVLIITINCIKYLIDVIKRKQKIDWLIFSLCLVLIVYMNLPIFPFSFTNSIKYLVIVVSIYLTYIYKETILLKEIINYSGLGIIVSSLFAIVLNPESRIMSNVSLYYEADFQKFNALFWNPNCLGIYLIILMSGTAIHIIKTKDLSYVALFCCLFLIGYNTISRNFLLCSFVITFLILLFGFIRQKKQFLKTSILLVFSMVLLCMLMFDQTKLYVSRFLYSEEIQTIVVIEESNLQIAYQHEFNNAIYSSQDLLTESEMIYDDPGRIGLWKKYISDIAGDTKVLIFGKGVSATWLGYVPAHNGFIQIIWNFGLCGTALILILCVTILVKKRVSLDYSILIMVFGLLSVFENTIFNMWTYILFVYIMSKGELSDEKRSIKKNS